MKISTPFNFSLCNRWTKYRTPSRRLPHPNHQQWARHLGLLAAVSLLAGACLAQPVLKPCHLAGMRDAVQCGTLERPLNPADPKGKQIDIHFAVLPSKAREKHADPIYLLAGGPGQSAMEVIPAMQGALSRLNNRRDLVFVDQRGTGQSAPLLCQREAELSLADALDPAQLPERMARCRAALEKLPHGDLRFYSTSIAMADLDAVRAALGQDTINLVGASYGTRAALEYLRLYPKHVRRMVIDGVAPASQSLPQSMAQDANTALAALFADCAREPACAKAHTTLASQWDALFNALPQKVTLNNPLTGLPEQVTLTAPMVAAMVRGPLYVPQLAAALPQAIAEAAQGRWTALVGLASVNTSRSGVGMSMGMHFSVLCSEDPLRSSDAANAGHFAGVMDAAYAGVCATWPRAQVDPAFYTLAPTSAPVLMLSGGVDPATPPRHANAVAQALGAKVRHIVVPQAGHGLLRLGCTSDLVFKFLDNKDEAKALDLDAACLAGIPRPTAFVPLSATLESRP